MQFRADLGRVQRIELLHGGCNKHGLVVERRSIRIRILVETLLVGGLERRAGSDLVEDGAALGAEHRVVCGVASQLGGFRHANRVPAKHLGFDAQALHLLDHGASLTGITTVEDDIRVLGLHVGQDRAEVDGLVGGVFLADDGQPEHLGFLDELVGQALAKGRAVVDHAGGLGLHAIHCILGHAAADQVVSGDDPEHALVAAHGDLGVAAHGGQDCAARVIHLGRGNRHPGAIRPHHVLDAGIHHFLRHRHARLGVALVVF